MPFFGKICLGIRKYYLTKEQRNRQSSLPDQIHVDCPRQAWWNA